ncbi:hypothetical protein M378DRAFT_90577 [Amanita muscaria Koide BX008]|uniref:Uncharacterized protein n=1 Tax=Amanita muscaria (strain Koide BX008) TaxID=946122 RepID=A0A0C2WGC1_AMAMK|nr:hypothetical protein M378DRAFT_90577 [Amanita muscaria Koide BX008]
MLENALELDKEIKSLHAFQDKIVKDLVTKYKKSEKEIRTLVFSKPILKTRRRPNLRNALLHRKAKELNDGRSEGERLSLVEIQETSNIGEELKDLSEERKEELLNELKDHRELKQTGARASNASAAQDLRQTMDRMATELQNLSHRVGCISFLFTTRGHVQDHGIPGFVLTGNAADFIQDILDMPPWDLIRKYEQWACAHDPGKGMSLSNYQVPDVPLANPKTDTFQSMRIECTKLISEGLKKITQPDPIAMNYINYDLQIVQRRRVKLAGWPSTVKFISPSNMTCTGDARSLLHALRTKTCRWVQLSPGEAAGEVVGRKRKERSDKGRKRKRRNTDEQEQDPDEDSHPSFT